MKVVTWGDLKTMVSKYSERAKADFDSILHVVHSNVNRSYSIPEIYKTRWWYSNQDTRDTLTEDQRLDFKVSTRTIFLPDETRFAEEDDGNGRSPYHTDTLAQITTVNTNIFSGIERRPLTQASIEAAEKAVKDLVASYPVYFSLVNGGIKLFPNEDHGGVVPTDLRLQYQPELPSPFDESGNLIEEGGSDNIILQKHTFIYLYEMLLEIMLLNNDMEKWQMVGKRLEIERKKYNERLTRKYNRGSMKRTLPDSVTLNNQVRRYRSY